MATLIDCPHCRQRLRLQTGLDLFWMQCPACGRTFLPQQLPFRLPAARKFDQAEGHNEEEPAELALAALPALEADVEDDGEGGWHGSCPNVRRDCEPHRALWIGLLGNGSLMLGSMAMVLCGVPGLLGLPLGIAAWLMGNHDLERMRRGLMDPCGLLETRRGRESGILGVVLSALFLLGYGLFLLALHPF